MPFINGCYISKKQINQDVEFLESQGLSGDQITAIKSYYLQRITSNAYYVLFSFLGIMLCSYVVGMALSEFS